MLQEKWQRGFCILSAAAILGLLADLLLREIPPGINVLLWTAALVGLLAAIAHRCKLPLQGGGRWLLLVILGFAAATAWRDSPTLKTWNLIAAVGALAIVMVRGRAGDVRSLGIVQTVVCGGIALLNVCVGAVLLVYCDLPWRTAASEDHKRRVAAVVRGILLAVPLLLIFGALFFAADAAFASFVSPLFRFDPYVVLSHTLCMGLTAWAAAGFLRGTLLRDEENLMSVTRPDWLAVGSTEIGIVLGALNGLFLLFICLQVPYFFGGQVHVVTTAGLTAADYARRGFFELVTVAGMVLPLLLAAQGLLRDEFARVRRWFSPLAGLLALLTFLVMASAVQRMALYYVGFGLTELRFYTTVFMGWLAAVFLWYGATVLRGRSNGFWFGTLAIGFATLALLDCANPDAVIVRANAARLRTSRTFDAKYAGSLCADAVPALIETMPRLSDADKHTLATALSTRWLQSKSDDWRAWSAGRAAARSAVSRAAATIGSLVSPHAGISDANGAAPISASGGR